MDTQPFVLPTATIVAFCGNITKNCPPGWLPCDGSLIPSNYVELITILSSNNTPNLIGRALVGSGSSSTAGQNADGKSVNWPASQKFELLVAAGEFQHTLTIDEMPAHTHDVPHEAVDGQDSGGDDINVYIQSSPTPSITGSTGSGDSHNNMQPYIVVNYIIYTGN